MDDPSNPGPEGRGREGSRLPTALLRFVNKQHGTTFEPLGCYPTGEQGAFAIGEAEGRGERFVLKWWQGTTGATVPAHLRRAEAVTVRLRLAGYPAPLYRLVGVAAPLELAYVVQEALPGAPLGERLDRSCLNQLLVLNDLQRDRAIDPPGSWPAPVTEPVLRGGDGFCLLEPLRSYSLATRALLDDLQRLAFAGAKARAPASDVVHFDFQGSNILVDGDRISGVVDWEGCCAGDRAFDLATLYFYAGADETADPEQVDRLWQLLQDRSGAKLLGVYLAHLVLRQVDWSIRFHDRIAVDRWLGRADDVLRRQRAAIEADQGP